MVLLMYLAAGAFAGTVAGLLGVGGGIVVVPVLIIAFEAQGFSPQILTHLAIGTSLATIVFTSASAVWSHHRRGSVCWSVLSPMMTGIVAGAILGVMLVVRIDGQVLKQMIGVFAILVSLKMLLNPHVEGRRAIPGGYSLASFGVFAGAISAMLGIGGGTLTVPYLSRLRLSMYQVIGTASACGFPIALVGAMMNMLVGRSETELPEWSLGFVYLPALFGVALASMICARFGVKLAHRLPGVALRRAFAGALLIVGARFLLS